MWKLSKLAVTTAILASAFAAPSFATKVVSDRFLLPSTWVNGGCADYYGQLIRTRNVGPNVPGSLYSGTVMVVGQTLDGKYTCNVLNYGSGYLKSALEDAMRHCKNQYRIVATSCQPWAEVD